jgi:hypothetical protein
VPVNDVFLAGISLPVTVMHAAATASPRAKFVMPIDDPHPAARVEIASRMTEMAEQWPSGGERPAVKTHREGTPTRRMESRSAPGRPTRPASSQHLRRAR